MTSCCVVELAGLPASGAWICEYTGPVMVLRSVRRVAVKGRHRHLNDKVGQARRRSEERIRSAWGAIRRAQTLSRDMGSQAASREHRSIVPEGRPASRSGHRSHPRSAQLC